MFVVCAHVCVHICTCVCVGGEKSRQWEKIHYKEERDF